MATQAAKFLRASTSLTKSFERFVFQNNLEEAVRPDNISYKCGTREEFEKVRSIFELRESGWMEQQIISDRRFVVLKLTTPLPTYPQPLPILKIADQKPDGSQSAGFDHIEVLPNGFHYDVLIDFLRGKGIELKEMTRSGHTTHDMQLGEFLIKFSRESIVERMAKLLRA